MLPTDLPRVDNLEVCDHRQTPLYSLLTTANNVSSTIKRATHRKKRSKIDETIPVTINPQLTRNPMPMNFTSPVVSTVPYRLYLDAQSYDANNNLHHNGISSHFIPTISCDVSSNSNDSETTRASNSSKMSFLALNRALASQTPIRPSLNQLELFPPKKTKQKRLKTVPLPINVEHQSIPNLTSYSDQCRSNTSLPLVIPNSVVRDDGKYPTEMGMHFNYTPMTPPTSIISVRSPPLESSSMAIPSYLLQKSVTNHIEDNPTSRLYHSQTDFTRVQPQQRTHFYSNNVHRLVTNRHPQYYIVPSNSQALPYSPVLTNTRPVTNEQSKKQISPLPEKKKKRKQKRPILDVIDHRTKSQWKHLSRRNRSAVWKFLIQKRKQQQQQAPTATSLEQVEVENLDNTEIAQNPRLTDIIAPSLKISFDSNQKIDSISLFYHRRRQLTNNDETTSKVLKTSENKLDLLLEAVEFIETQNEKSNCSTE